MLLSLGLGGFSLLLTALITWAWIGIARAKKIQDQPERRRLHQASVPRAGGVSIAIVILETCIVFFFVSPHPESHWALITTAIFLYGALGFFDDVLPLRSHAKLLLHFLVIAVLFLIAKFSFAMGLAFSIYIALAYLLMVNVWNFMDGSNGMISMQSLIIAAGFFALSVDKTDTQHFSLVLAAACLGFLPFNFPNARVFPGDVGSHVLGAAIVSLALLAYGESQWSFPEILCLASALWIDAVLTLVRRSVRGFKITQAHRSHLYQYLVRSGQSHAAVCMYYAAWTISVIFIVRYGRQLPEASQRILQLAVIATGFAIHQWLRLFVLKSARISKEPIQS